MSGECRTFGSVDYRRAHETPHVTGDRWDISAAAAPPPSRAHSDANGPSIEHTFETATNAGSG